MTFDEMIYPLTRDAFISEYAGERWVHVGGAPDRFSALAPWDAINQALSRDRFAGDRLSLAKNGKIIPVADYLTKPHDASGAQVNADGLIRHLKSGATLIMGSVDELLPEVRTLVEDLEDVFRIDVGVNLYAGWKADNGFNLHWDDHDALVLQIAGRKHWRVYAPTLLHPLTSDAGKVPPPTVPPVWEGELLGGELLYLPRGWWHIAYPMNEPSLHLTCALGHHTGFELLRWIVQELKTDPLVRTDLPHLATEKAQAAFVDRLADLIRQRLTPDVVASFMRWSDRFVRLRPLVSLPDDVAQTPVTLGPESLLRLAVDRQLHVRAAGPDGSVGFVAAGEQWSCQGSLVPGLRLLRGGRHIRLQTIVDAVAPSDQEALRSMLNALTATGAIMVRNAASGSRR